MRPPESLVTWRRISGRLGVGQYWKYFIERKYCFLPEKYQTSTQLIISRRKNNKWVGFNWKEKAATSEGKIIPGKRVRQFSQNKSQLCLLSFFSSLAGITVGPSLTISTWASCLSLHVSDVSGALSQRYSPSLQRHGLAGKIGFTKIIKFNF